MSSSLPIYVEKSLASLHESPSPDTDDGDDVYMAMPKPEFDHWSRSDTAVTPSRFPRVIKTFKKIADIPEPEEPGRTIVRKLNAVLRFRYKRIRWFVIELYQHLKLGTYDEINERHLANKSPRMEFLSDQISIVRDGLPGGNVIVDEHNFRVYPVQALWQEIKRAGGQPIPMPTELERVVTKLIGEPPERIYEPIVPWWVESSNLRTPPIEKKKLEVPIELSHVRLNVTLSKMYKMMSLMLNEISERVLREDWGPPTLTVETNVLCSKLLEMKKCCRMIIRRIVKSGNMPFRIPQDMIDDINLASPVTIEPNFKLLQVKKRKKGESSSSLSPWSSSSSSEE